MVRDRPGASGAQRPSGEWRPTREQIAAARDKTVPDVVAPGLRVLFVGINPGLYTAAVGHHFARPGNRFWKALHAGGFTDRLLSPFEERELLDRGYGITNLVARATPVASELSDDELRAGADLLTRKVARLRPLFVAFVGMDAYRVSFRRPKATVGLQEETIQAARVWVLPNPSGLNANYQLPALAKLFGELRVAADAVATSSPRRPSRNRRSADPSRSPRTPRRRRPTHRGPAG